MRLVLAVAFGLAAWGGWRLWSRPFEDGQAPQPAGAGGLEAGDFSQDWLGLDYLFTDYGAGGSEQPEGWRPPERAVPYISTIRDAERHHGLPHNLLARLIHQESRYRDDIISGETVSSAGAVGIAQIVPKWHPDVDPLDPQAAIWYAAKYLRQLYQQFGTWRLALAAYNWGPGNLSRYGFERAPSETQQYVRQISRDVGLA